MAFIDLILAVIVLAFVIFGLFFGLIHTVGSLIGTIVAIIFATRFIDPVVNALGPVVGDSGIGKVILFIVLFLVINRLVGFLFWILEKIFGFLKFVPFAKTVDRLLGGVFGFVEGVIVVGMVTYYALQVLPEDTLLNMLESSVVAQYLISLVKMFQVLIPEGLRLVLQVLV